MKTYALTNPYMKGDDLRPMQKALIAAGVYHGEQDGIFGPATANASKQAKWRLGYAQKFCTPTAGQTLLDYLTGKKGLPLIYRVRRHRRGFGDQSQDQQQRATIVDYALWGVQNEAQIHYVQYRPMDHLKAVKRLPWSADCSEFITTIYKWADAPDPNGSNYNGLGYTGTMMVHGENVSLDKALPGDAVIWGTYPGHHTAVIVKVDGKYKGDPLLVSHGMERGPVEVTLSVETGIQHRSYVIKSYID